MRVVQRRSLRFQPQTTPANNQQRTINKNTQRTTNNNEQQTNRFSISGNKVSWLGWEFYVGNKPTSGGRLWDIRFKGERVVYELSLQEEMAGAPREYDWVGRGEGRQGRVRGFVSAREDERMEGIAKKRLPAAYKQAPENIQ